MKNGWTGGQYSVYRALFGAYLAVHFAHLVPWGPELFSDSGVLAEGSRSPLLGLFPNVLALFDAPLFVQGLLVLGVAAAVLFGIGYRDRLAAGFAWYVLACLLGRNPLIANPSLPFVGWLLLAHLLVPPAPYGSVAARVRADPGDAWHLPETLFLAAWIVMSLGYTYSGATKLVSPSWVDGTAVARVLANPLARPGPIRDALLALPRTVLSIATWGALAFELLFAPFALIPRLRPFLWGGMLCLHLSLMLLIDFADLSIGMVVLHLFTFDPAWIDSLRRPFAPSPAPWTSAR